MARYVLNAVHKLQDQLQQTLALDAEEVTQNSHRTRDVGFQRQRCICSHGGLWRPSGKMRPSTPTTRKFAEAAETYHNAIKRTLEKTEALERHVKTVTMRVDSLVTTEADFFQTPIGAPGGVHTGTQKTVRPTVPTPLHTEVAVRTTTGIVPPQQAERTWVTAKAAHRHRASPHWVSRWLPCVCHAFCPGAPPYGRQRPLGCERSRTARSQTSPLQPVLHEVREAPMGDCDGLLVPRPAHTAGPSHEGRALAWTLVSESGQHSSSYEARHLQPSSIPNSAVEASRVDAQDHFSGLVQRLDTNPGEQRRSRRCSRWQAATAAAPVSSRILSMTLCMGRSSAHLTIMCVLADFISLKSLSPSLRLSVSPSLRLQSPPQRYEPSTNSHSRRLSRLPDHPQTTAPSRHHITNVSPNCHLCAPPAPTRARPELPGPTRSISTHVSFACPCGLSDQHHFPFLRSDSGFPPCLPCHRHGLALADQEPTRDMDTGCERFPRPAPKVPPLVTFG